MCLTTEDSPTPIPCGSFLHRYVKEVRFQLDPTVVTFGVDLRRFFSDIYSMPSSPEKFTSAIAAFDAYHERDPNSVNIHGIVYPGELLYAIRMTDQLSKLAPNAGEVVRLAARCQHIGRWEIARNEFPMDRKGYLQWRNAEKIRHAAIAEKILIECGYDRERIDEVSALILKKGIQSDNNTQLLEDVACLVFIEHYLAEFASRHSDEKVVDILRKTLKKMSATGKAAVASLKISAPVRSLLERATIAG